MLKRVVAGLAGHGLRRSVAPEIEFSVFEEPIQRRGLSRYRDLTPLGGPSRITYLISRSPDLARFMDAVIGRLDALGVGWESWSSETAGGQAEINIAPTDPLSAADGVIRTKLALREVAGELGRSGHLHGRWSTSISAPRCTSTSRSAAAAENAFAAPTRDGEGARADAALDRRAAGDDARRDVVLQPDRELVPAAWSRSPGRRPRSPGGATTSRPRCGS